MWICSLFAVRLGARQGRFRDRSASGRIEDHDGLGGLGGIAERAVRPGDERARHIAFRESIVD